MAHIRKQMISFFLTTHCNLNCTYCYTPKIQGIKKEHQTLDLSFAKRGIDDYFRDSASRHIRFYGIGEPTLEFKLLKQIYNYAHGKAGDSLVVELQTNGFFAEEIARWIYKHVDILWVSCDGPPEVQDLQRPTANKGNTSGIVEKNLSYFATRDSMQVGVRVTLTSLTMKRQNEIVRYFNDLGIRYVNVLPAFAPVEGSSGVVFDWDPLEFAKDFLIAHNKAKELGTCYNTMCIVNFDEQTRYACRVCTPCPHLTTDGNVSCCDFAQLGPEYLPGPLQQLVYGEYNPENQTITYDENAVSEVRARCVENLKEGVCADCKYIYNCAGGCLGQVVNETGDLMGKCERNCTIVKYLGEHMELNKGLHPALHS